MNDSKHAPVQSFRRSADNGLQPVTCKQIAFKINKSNHTSIRTLEGSGDDALHCWHVRRSD